MDLIDYCKLLVPIGYNHDWTKENINTFDHLDLDLLQKVDIDQQDSRGNTALIIVSYRGYPNMVRSLLEQGANVNIENNEGNTALTLSIERVTLYYGRIFDALVQFNADLDHLNHKGDSPLSLANEDEETTLLLLENGADIDIQDKYGQTVVMKSCKGTYCNFLLDHGHNINLRDNKGQNLLMKATDNMFIDTLFYYGIEYDYLDNAKSSPLQVFIYRMEEDRYRWRFSRNRSRSEKYVTQLIESGVNVTVKCNRGFNVLHKLC